MRKVLVIGSGGSGKSTFSRRLGALLELDVIHLDSIYWSAGWVEMPKPEWRKTVEELLNRSAWIIDGNYSGTLEMRLAACDAVIFLDISRLVCVRRLLKRAVLYRNQRRPDMAEGCPERLNLDFIKWVLAYRKRSRPKIVRLLEATSKQVIWLRSPAEVKRFLGAIRPTDNSAPLTHENETLCHLCGPLCLCGGRRSERVHHRGTEFHRGCTEKDNSDRSR